MNRIPRKVKVVAIDHNGFNGREHHPTDADLGMVLTVRRVEIEDAGEVIDGEDASFEAWICDRPDGSPVEMIEFEIEPAE